LFDEALKLKERAERAEAEVKAIRAALGDDLLEWKISNCTLRAEVERLRDLLEAAYGLCQGYDWNNGTHSKTHGYKRKVLEAVHALKPVPDIEGKRHSFGGAALAPAPEESNNKDK
jgi:hypothetical protein